MKAHVLVTGGSGYIGSVMVPKLLLEGYEVTVVDNLMYRQTSLLSCCRFSHFHFIRADVLDEPVMRKAISKCDILIPLAAIVGAPACQLNALLSQSVNVDAIRLLLKLSSKEQKIFFPNTNSGYGVGSVGSFCTEESPLQPVSLYGLQKVEAEKILLDSGRAMAFRLATVFGVSPRMRLDLLVNDFTYRAVVDRFIVLFEEHFKRNYIHIDDVASAFLFAIEHFDEMKGQAFNLGLSAANLSKRELCEKIREIAGDFYIHAAEVGKDIDQRNYIVSNEKIERLGFLSKKSLEEGICELIEAYKMIRISPFANV